MEVISYVNARHDWHVNHVILVSIFRPNMAVDLVSMLFRCRKRPNCQSWLHFAWIFSPLPDKNRNSVIKLINFARVQRLGWYGHVERMQETWMVKAIHAWKPISKRPMGRPKISWEDDVKKYIQRLKVPNWKNLVQDRRRWKEVVGKAKILH